MNRRLLLVRGHASACAGSERLPLLLGRPKRQCANGLVPVVQPCEQHLEVRSSRRINGTGTPRRVRGGLRSSPRPSRTATAMTRSARRSARRSPRRGGATRTGFRGAGPAARFAVVERLLRDPAFLRAGSEGEAPPWRMLACWLISLDGDRHRRLRHRFAGLFGARTVERFRKAITQCATALLDAVGGEGHMDVVTDFARPLPFAVITGVMGVPESARPVIWDLPLTVNRAFAHQGDPEALARGHEAAEELQRRFGELLDARAREPADDLVSALAAGRACGVRKCGRALVGVLDEPEARGVVSSSGLADLEVAIARVACVRRAAARDRDGPCGRALVGLQGARDRGAAPRA